ncbi:MAG: membrane protein insertion efficiency factor YidD [bacterium]
MMKLIRKYQTAFAGRRPRCRYSPTCSNYALQAYENYNFFYATILTVWRILRCNPLSRGGYDPIPKYKKILKAQLKAEEDAKNKNAGSE